MSGTQDHLIWLLLAAVLVCLGPIADAAVWYVDQDSLADPPTGTSWSSAFSEIQQGIDAAFADGGGEVWVAEGYYVENGIVNMRNGVDVYGGFAGTETAREQRDWHTHPVTIDGSTANGGTQVSHVVTGANARFDGFSITGGRAIGAKGKQGIDGGGGMLILNVSCTVANCFFYDNVGNNGGAVYVSNTPAALFEDCVFYSNTGNVNGGGVYIDNGGSGATITIRNCHVDSNTAGLDGGGLYLGFGNIQLVNSLIVSNRAIEGTGGGVYSIENTGDVVNCTISQNQSIQPGAGLVSALTGSTATVNNSIIWENFNFDQDSAIEDLTSTLDVRYSCIGGGYPGTGNIDQDPVFAVGEGLLYSLTEGSPCINAGDPAGVPPAPATDIDGVTRPQGPRVDMGAFEYVGVGEGEGEGEGEPIESVLIVRVVDAATEQNIVHSVVRVEPQGLVSGASLNGTHFFDLVGPVTCQVFVTATGYSPASLTETIDVSVENVRVALTPNPNGSPDSDGDGLTDNDEITRFSTNPANADTDSDGLSDLFEIEYNFDPLLPNENTDADGDRLTDLEEFFRRSDPNNPNDPRKTYFVSSQSGPEGDGSAALPFRSIGAAIVALENQVDAEHPAALLLLPGTFQEDVALQPGFELYDATPPQESAIAGRITGAANTVLSGISVYEPDDAPSATPLIEYQDGNARLLNLFVQGLEQSAATGLRFVGNAVDTVTIRDCVLDGFAAGVDVVNALPSILRTQVYNGQDGIVFRAAKQGGAENTLGDATDANSGWNRFSGQSENAAVNERSDPIKMENVDWDTDSAEQVDNLIEGPADFEPFLAKGAGLLPSSVTCVVWDAVTRARITNASATISPGGYTPVTENVDGVYTFAAIPGAQYTVRVEAANYPVKEQVISVEAGASANLVFPLGGEAFIEDICGCAKAYQSGTPRRETVAGNMLLAFSVIGLSLLRWRRRR